MSPPIKRTTFRSMHYLLIATGLLLSLDSALVQGQELLPETIHSPGYHSSSNYLSSSFGSLVSQPAAGSTVSRRTYTYVRPAARPQHSPSFVYHNRHFHPFSLFSFHTHSQPQPQPFHFPYFRFGSPTVNYASAQPVQPATGSSTIQYWPPTRVAAFPGSSLSPLPSSASSSSSNVPAGSPSAPDSTLANTISGRPSTPSSSVLSSGARPLYRRPSGVVVSRPRPAVSVSVPAPSPTASSSSTSVITNSGDADIGFDAPVTSNSDSSSLAGPTVSAPETSGSNAPANSTSRPTDNLEASASSSST